VNDAVTRVRELEAAARRQQQQQQQQQNGGANGTGGGPEELVREIARLKEDNRVLSPCSPVIPLDCRLNPTS